MKNFKEVWKSLAKAKTATAADVMIYNIFKAMTAKNPNKEEVIIGLLQRAFTPVSRPSKLSNGRRAYDILSRISGQTMIYANKVFDFKAEPTTLLDCFENVQEIEKYKKLVTFANINLGKHVEDYYSYVFVRQDLHREQQIVQASHVTLVLGSKLNGHNPKNLNFVVCGAKDLEDLKKVEAYINDHGVETVDFVESDLNNEVTAIASFPIGVKQKSFMKRYKLLKFEK